MEHQTLFGKEAKQKLKEGVDLVANAVAPTLGAKGRNVMCIREGMLPVITKDGVSIAKEIDSADIFVSAGASAIKQVATQTGESVSDGTTTSSVLAQAILTRAHEEDDRVNTISLKRGIDKATEAVVEELKKYSVKSSSLKTLRNIANISTNGDAEITKLVVEAITKVGKIGSIKIEETEEVKSSVVVEKGYEIDSPYLDYRFITNPEKLTAELENCYVLVYEGHLVEEEELNTTLDLLSYENGANKNLYPLLIICDNISTTVQNKILAWRLAGVPIMNVKSPSFGTRRTEALQDIVSIVGGKVYTSESEDKLTQVDVEGLGKISKVISDSNKTILVGGEASEETKKNRIEIVSKQVKSISGGKKEKDYAKERLSKLTSGIAVINVGGMSQTERREKTDRVDDALAALRACLEEGYLAGGGSTYLKIAEKLKQKDFKVKNDDEQKGVNILLEAIAAPFRQILKNAGIEYAEYEKMVRESEYGIGFNVVSEKIANLLEDGVIDPTKVSRMALQNAASIAGTFLTTEVMNFNSTGLFTKQ